MLPAEAAVLVFTLVDLIAAANKGLDGRTVDQRRADAIADIADELLTYGFVDLDGLVARAERGAASPAAPDADANADAAEPAHATEPTDVERTCRHWCRSQAVPVAAPSDVAVVAVPDGAGCRRRRRCGRSRGGIGRRGWSRAGTRHGRRPHLNVTGAWTTLSGLDDLPGQLDGYGTITADLLRAIATSWGTVTAVGVDPAIRSLPPRSAV